jgi:hypothetical protein
MKSIYRLFFSAVIIIALLGSNVYAQDCNLLRETDPYTKLTRISSGFLDLTGASVTVDADKKEIDILFSFKTDRCFDDACTAIISFTDTKLKLNLRNAGTMNCEGLFHFIFKNGPTVNYQLKKLATMKVNQLIFKDRNEKEIPVLLTPEMQEAFLRAVQCVSNEALTLL